MGERLPERIELADVLLRRERVADAALVAQTVGANLEHLRPWMPWAVPSAATIEEQQQRAARVEHWWDAGSDFTFLLLDASETACLGLFGLHRRVGPDAVELGYWLSYDAVGKGHATAAARALTAAALTLPNVDRVEIHCDEANVRSRGVPERLGYRLDRIEADEIAAPAEIGRSLIWVYPPRSADRA